MLEFAEANQWDKLTIEDAIDTTSDAIVSFKRFVTDTINGTSTPSPIVESARQAAEKRTKEAKESAKKALIESRARAQAVLAELKTTVHHEVKGGEEKLTAIAKHQVGQITDALDDVVKKAEDALAGKGDAEKIKVEAVDTTPKEPSTSVDEAPTEESSDKNIYNAPLPVGFEPPPGYTRPAPPKKLASESKAAPEPFSLPLVSPAVSSFETSEPIITHLAGTIDNLASYLASNPSVAAKATDVLETAKSDLTALAERIDKAREEERYALETKLDEQTREYSLKLMELEMEAQDKLDHQEEGFRKFFEEERAKFIAAYRARLDYELKTQTELINERYVVILHRQTYFMLTTSPPIASRKRSLPRVLNYNAAGSVKSRFVWSRSVVVASPNSMSSPPTLNVSKASPWITLPTSTKIFESTPSGRPSVPFTTLHSPTPSANLSVRNSVDCGTFLAHGMILSSMKFFLHWRLHPYLIKASTHWLNSQHGSHPVLHLN